MLPQSQTAETEQVAASNYVTTNFNANSKQHEIFPLFSFVIIVK